MTALQTEYMAFILKEGKYMVLLENIYLNGFVYKWYFWK